jgi:hypothetical protein
MRIKLTEIRVVGQHRVSSVPPSAWSLPAPWSPLERAAKAAGHCGCGRGPALHALRLPDSIARLTRRVRAPAPTDARSIIGGGSVGL